MEGNRKLSITNDSSKAGKFMVSRLSMRAAHTLNSLMFAGIIYVCVFETKSFSRGLIFAV